MPASPLDAAPRDERDCDKRLSRRRAVVATGTTTLLRMSLRTSILRHNLVRQHAYTFEVDFDGVAGLNRLRHAGSAGEDHVAGVERTDVADAGDEGGAIVDEFVRPLVLFRFTVVAELQPQVVVVEAGDDGRADRAEGVGALGTPPLDVGFLPDAGRDVVADRHAEDVILRFLFRDFLRHLADDDDHFGFVMDGAGVFRENDVGPVRHEARNGLEERLHDLEFRGDCAGGFAVDFGVRVGGRFAGFLIGSKPGDGRHGSRDVAAAEMALIIAGHRVDVLRFARDEELDVGAVERCLRGCR